MTIYYIDDLGEVALEINGEYGVGFSNGYAYFNDTENVDYRIEANRIIEILDK